MNHTIAQERSAFALLKLASIANQSDKKKQGFGDYAKGLPTMILSNGLAQTFAFILQKKKDSLEIKMIEWTIEWFGECGLVNKQSGGNINSGGFMVELSQLPQQQYLACQNECLALWEWVKRYSNSFIF